MMTPEGIEKLMKLQAEAAKWPAYTVWGSDFAKALRNNASALLSAAATLLKVREAIKGVDVKVVRQAVYDLDDPFRATAIKLAKSADAIAKVQALLEEREGAQ